MRVNQEVDRVLFKSLVKVDEWEESCRYVVLLDGWYEDEFIIGRRNKEGIDDSDEYASKVFREKYVGR